MTPYTYDAMLKMAEGCYDMLLAKLRWLRARIRTDGRAGEFWDRARHALQMGTLASTALVWVKQGEKSSDSRPSFSLSRFADTSEPIRFNATPPALPADYSDFAPAGLLPASAEMAG
jgi:hypothetical protein